MQSRGSLPTDCGAAGPLPGWWGPWQCFGPALGGDAHPDCSGPVVKPKCFRAESDFGFLSAPTLSVHVPTGFSGSSILRSEFGLSQPCSSALAEADPQETLRDDRAVQLNSPGLTRSVRSGQRGHAPLGPAALPLASAFQGGMVPY